MEQWLKTILLLSVMGAALTLLLLLCKPLTRRAFGSRWQYYIWLVVLVIMVLPIRIPLPDGTVARAPSQQPELQAGMAAEQETAQAAQAGQPAAPDTQMALAAGDLQPNRILENGRVGMPNGIKWNLFALFGWVWLVGCLAVLAGGLFGYFRFLHILRREAADTACPELDVCRTEMGIRRPIRVRTTTLLAAPMMTGLFRPVLLLPGQPLSGQPLRYVLLHELTHYKRHDLWYKWFAFFVKALHWFNPLIYLAVRQINESCEISCDLAVTKDMSEEEKAGYMGTILRLSSMQKQN